MVKDTEQSANDRIIYSVKEINRQIHAVLKETFQKVWIQGEISNLRFAASGHCYFSIKDEDAVISAVLFKRAISPALLPHLVEGSSAVFFGDISVYEQRGQYQIIVQTVEPAGQGNAFLAFEQLKKKLMAEGLFSSERKKDLPIFPDTVGIITSPSGAALQDILRVSKKRMPCIDIIVYPTLVQGSEAALQIMAAIDQANTDNKADILIIARGGGSLEDLMPFNDEAVARAIAASPIPTVAGIGHETDFSIADFVSDIRAATPSAAAETVFPNRIALLDGVESTKNRIRHHVLRSTERARESADRFTAAYLLARIRNGLDRKKMHLDALCAEVQTKSERIIERNRAALKGLSGKIQALDPKAPFRKGFALVHDSASGTLIKSAGTLEPGRNVALQFQDGTADAAIQKIHCTNPK